MTRSPRIAAALLAATLLPACSTGPDDEAAEAKKPMRAPAAVVDVVESLDTDPENSYGKDMRETLNASISDPLDTGLRVVAETDSWSPDGPDAGVLIAAYKMPGLPDRHVKLVVGQEGGEWKVLSMLDSAD